MQKKCIYSFIWIYLFNIEVIWIGLNNHYIYFNTQASWIVQICTSVTMPVNTLNTKANTAGLLTLLFAYCNYGDAERQPILCTTNRTENN